MEPLIVLGPGHAIVGLRLSPNSSQAIFIETTMVGLDAETVAQEAVEDGEELAESDITPENLFERACKTGRETYQAWKDEDNLRIVDIKMCRQQKIYPAFTN